MESDGVKQYQYAVVDFLEKSHRYIDDYVCIPCSWIEMRTAQEITVAYPIERPSVTRRRIKDSENPSGNWKRYMAVVKFETNSYQDGLRFILKNIYKDIDFIARVTVTKNFSAECSTAALEEQYTALMERALEIESEAENVKKMKMTDEISSLNKSVESSLKNNESWEEDIPLTVLAGVTNASYQEKNKSVETSNQSADEYLKEGRSLMADKVITNDKRDDYRNKSPAPSSDSASSPEHSLSEKAGQLVKNFKSKIETRAEHLTGVIEKLCIDSSHVTDMAYDLHKANVMSFSVFKLLGNTYDGLKDLDKVVVVKPKLDIQEVVGVKQDLDMGKGDRHTDRSIHHALKRANVDNENEDKKATKCPKRERLPPEYDPNDSHWTLKYRENDPALGLVELVPKSNVWVDPIRLAHAKRLSKDYKTLAGMLMEEIFTESALSVCSLTGAKANNAFYKSGADVKPGLDNKARLVMMLYVKNYGRGKKWGPIDTEAVDNYLRFRLNKIRIKCNIN